MCLTVALKLMPSASSNISKGLLPSFWAAGRMLLIITADLTNLGHRYSGRPQAMRVDRDRSRIVR